MPISTDDNECSFKGLDVAECIVPCPNEGEYVMQLHVHVYMYMQYIHVGVEDSLFDWATFSKSCARNRNNHILWSRLERRPNHVAGLLHSMKRRCGFMIAHVKQNAILC